MKNSPENKNFEKQWQEAFESAEIKPSDTIWKGVDAHLANKEAGNYKRGIVFYRWLAAASVVLLLSWGGYVLLTGNDQTGTGDPALVSIPSEEKTDPQNRTTPGVEDDLVADNNSNFAQSPDHFTDPEIEESQSLTANSALESENIIMPDPITSQENDNPSNPTFWVSNAENGIDKTSVTDLNNVPVLAYGLSIDDMTAPVDIPLEGRPVWDFELEEEKINDVNGLWAGLDFAPGVFDPNFSNGSTAANSIVTDNFSVPISNQVTNDQVDQGFSYGVSVNAGIPLSERWVLQSGLGYSVGNSETSTSLIVEDANGIRSALVFTNTEQLEDVSRSVSLSSSADVTSSYEFLSVPVRAGYALLKTDKIGLILSAGVSSDFLLQNTISSGQQGVESYRQGSGSNSPFRPVYFSGLSSLTLTYHLGSGYLIMLEPSYKAALNNFSKSSEVFESRPSNFGVGLGIRYQFQK